MMNRQIYNTGPRRYCFTLYSMMNLNYYFPSLWIDTVFEDSTINLPKGLKLKHLKYIGEGRQGKVYLIDNSHCIKIYKNLKYAKMELANLKRAEKKGGIFPKVYQWGKKYIIREYIEGIGLKKYLKSHHLTKSISRQLVDLIKNFKKIGYKRLDTGLTNVIITPKGILRPIDPTSAMLFRQSYPKHMLKQLKKKGLKKHFLEHVKKIDKKLYQEWKRK